MSSLLLFITTIDEEKNAASIIRRLLEEQLIACGTFLPKATSIYFWQGKMEESQEVVVFLKTTPALESACMQRLKALHPYEVPEILVIEPHAVGAEYRAWVESLGLG